MLLLLVFLLPTQGLLAKIVNMTDGFSAIFPGPGPKLVIKKITDVSRRNGRVDFSDGTKAKFTNIWMINYTNSNWNFPKERLLLKNKLDMIVLRNGKIFYDLVQDFSSRRKVYEFKNHKEVHWSKIRRIYIAKTIKFKQ